MAAARHFMMRHTIKRLILYYPNATKESAPRCLRAGRHVAMSGGFHMFVDACSEQQPGQLKGGSNSRSLLTHKQQATPIASKHGPTPGPARAFHGNRGPTTLASNSHEIDILCRSLRPS